jgi:hypothetical protein
MTETFASNSLNVVFEVRPDDPGMTMRQRLVAAPAALGGVVVVGTAVIAFLVFIVRKSRG